MKCPHCAGEMKADSAVSHWVMEGIRTADWMRCTRCDYACIQSSRSRRSADSEAIEEVA